MPIQFGEFTLDSAGRQLFRGSEAIHLSPKAFDVLSVLIERRPTAVSKTDLHELVWAGTFVADASLTMVITEVRKALGDEAQHPRFIRTVHRFGYAFIADGHSVRVEPDRDVRSVRLQPDPPGAWLVWNERALVLRDGQNTVGRDPQCEVWVDAAGVSRRHARVTVIRGAATLEDLGSKNGTMLDGASIRTVMPLSDGDVIQFGSVEMQFRLGSDRNATETVRLDRA
ncbi:MAG TPA: FHA domain-containing protein [Vicinamibacterales bacterium]|nr:FHA domain-containing protein [Vicinamibacterales bacterium]